MCVREAKNITLEIFLFCFEFQSCRVENEENESEPHSMWEYPCRALSVVYSVLNFTFLRPIPDEKQEINGNIEFTRYATDYE